LLGDFYRQFRGLAAALGGLVDNIDNRIKKKILAARDEPAILPAHLDSAVAAAPKMRSWRCAPSTKRSPRTRRSSSGTQTR
jgi:hypothetical protein